MKPLLAWTLVLGLVAATAAAFLAPWWILVAAPLLAFALPRPRSFLLFAAITVVFDAVLLSWANPGTSAWSLGPLTLGLDGARDGALGGLRLVAILGLNLAALARVSPASLLDGLRLPARATAFLAALLISAQDLGRDAARMHRASGGGIRQAVALVPAVMVLAVRRAEVRRDALQVAGLSMPGWFVPVVSLASVALAGRLLLVAVPNVALTFVVVFAGGLVFGARIAAAAAVVAMTLSDLILSGFVPTSFVNVPAMAIVAALGGLLRRMDFAGDQPRAGTVVAGCIGVLATFLFSVTADATEWFLVPEFRGNTAFLQARIAAGLAFNLVPAAVNGALFAWIVIPVQRAFRTL